MKKQVIFFSGGIPKENHLSYYDFLESKYFDPYVKKEKNRKYFLGEYLGDAYEYHIIPFPEVHFADYTAWKIVFEKMVPFLKDNVIFVATSLGGSFITKYLSENDHAIKINKLIMLAPAFYDTPDEVLGTFLPDVFKLESMKEQCDDIIIYHSIDDESVPFSDSENYLQLFPNATFRKFTDKGHFNFEKRIIEVEEDIKK